MASMPLEGLLSLGFAYCYKLSFHVLFREINSDPFFGRREINSDPFWGLFKARCNWA